jgi:hypothetical protein
MKRLLIITTLITMSLSGFTQKIKSFITPDFKRKPQSVFIYVGVSDKAGANERVLNQLLKEMPKNIFVKSQLIENSAWTQSPDIMLKNALKGLEVDAVMICSTLDSKDIEQKTVSIVPIANMYFVSPYKRNLTEYRYEFKVMDFKSNSVVYRAVSEPTINSFYPYKFIRKAVEDNIL